MPAIPTTVTMIGAGFVPAFRRVQQSGDFDCSFAVIAMICGTTLEAVRNVAIERFRHPAHGPYWITGDFIARLLAHYGYDTGMYEEPASVSDAGCLRGGYGRAFRPCSSGTPTSDSLSRAPRR
jgi:hypothetical protein